MRLLILLPFGLLAACGPATGPGKADAPHAESTSTTATAPAPKLLPPLPATAPEALAGKRYVDRYVDLIKRKQYTEARAMWDHKGADAGEPKAFAAWFEDFAQFDPVVGAPTAISVSDGQQFMSVRVSARARRKGQSRVQERYGPVMLRRSADPHEADPAKRDWQIWGMDIREHH